MSEPRIRHTKSVHDAEQVRDDLITQGYKVESQGESTTLLTKSSWGTVAGHLLVLLFTFWTVGFGNLIYALIVHKSDSVIVRVDEPEVLA